MDKEKIIIFDTTLRDGEQSPGATMTQKEKLQIATQLERLGVDVIEAGFPAASQGDFDSVSAIAQQAGEDITICGLARCVKRDIQRCAEAIKEAPRKRIHTFIATSPIHRECKLKMTRDEVLEQAVRHIELATSLVDDVEFSAEDACRTERDFLIEVVKVAIDAGAKTINLPDTVGYIMPEEYKQLILELKSEIASIDQAILSVHCHDDLGCSVANSLSAIQVGARQVECTINGLGERAGNCSLEEIVMAIDTRSDFFPFFTNINKSEIVKTSRLVAEVTHIPVQPNKAIVGNNAFAHEAGIHQDGILKERRTYEIMNPVDIGWKKSELILGKHSGRHAFTERLKELGFSILAEEVSPIFEKFKALCDQKKYVYDEDIRALAQNKFSSLSEDHYQLDSLDINYKESSDRKILTQVVLLDKDHQKKVGKGIGNGPVESLFQSVAEAVSLPFHLKEYDVSSVSKGEDALGRVVLTVSFGDSTQEYRGYGLHIDILVASLNAFIEALNRYMFSQ